MAIELIAIDMDGTLLDPQHQITPAVKQAIAAARRKGVHVVLATGRPYVGVQDYLRQLDIQGPGDFCITYNGALVLRAADGACILQETRVLRTICTSSRWRASSAFTTRHLTSTPCIPRTKTSANTPYTRRK